ncbi:MAG TPA: hypothetical protein VM759_00080 [Longimicrobium sp.]|nr:hypothetical protein [Longimicrobium sp.]
MNGGSPSGLERSLVIIALAVSAAPVARRWMSGGSAVRYSR